MEIPARLGDLGEFRILGEHVIPALGDVGTHLGDDCAFVGINTACALAVTSDRGPLPLAWSIEGARADYADAGWLAVVASISDLATTGARPLVITNNIEAPTSMLIADLRRYVVGIAAACRKFGFTHAGGDLSKGEQFSSHTTAIGIVDPLFKVGRHGCVPGEHVVAIGPMGTFAAAYLRAQRDGLESLTPLQRKALLRPRPQLSAMQRLTANGLVSAASDCSDGVLGALANLSEASGFGIQLETDRIEIPTHVAREAAANGLSHWNILFFWGDWQVVATTSHLERVIATVSPEHVSVLGRVIERGSGVWHESDDVLRSVSTIRNEGFTRHGWAQDPRAHVRYMLETPIF